MIRKILFGFSLSALIFFNAKAQITVNANANANNLAQKLVGYGVNVSNAVLNCPQIASSDFTVISSNLGLDSGISLTSGNGTAIAAPPGSPSTASGAPGDADLTLLCNKPTYDACILEFDFTTIGDTVKFNYVFGSTEYPSFTCTNFNDVFGFFLSGPGLSGPYSSGAINLALVPGSTTCPVGVSTIYCPNSPGCCNTTNTNCFGLTPGCGAFNATNNTCAYFVCNAGTPTVAYPGFTVPLTAISQVIPCSTYHMKLAIADASDQILDSGVFIESGSFSSNEVTVKLNAGLTTPNGDPYIIEGCDTVDLLIKRKIVLGTANADTVQFLIQGTAINGTDYNTLQDTLIFTANLSDTVRTLQLYAFNDGLPEGTETIKIYVMSGCSLTVTDSLVIEVRDSLSFSLFNNDTSICLGDTVFIAGQADSGITITWLPTTYVNDPNTVNTFVYPTSYGSNTYTISGTYGSCQPDIKTIKINTDPIPVLASIQDFEICQGDATVLNGSVSPPFNYNISWISPSGLSNTGGLTPTYTGTVTQDIILNVSSVNAGCSASDTIHVDVWPYATGTIMEDTLVCNGSPTQIWATSSTNQFFWYPSSTLSCNTCPNPISSALGSMTYNVVLVEAHGCNDTLEINVDTHPPFNLVLHNNDTIIYFGDQVQLFASGAPHYLWSPNTWLNFIRVPNPVATPFQDITYYVTGLSEYLGCPQVDSVHITVIQKDLFIPNAFSPNGDGRNDIFRVIAGKFVNVQEFRVYNRWGQEVFYTNDINQGWDGTFKGVPQNQGTYYYLIKAAFPTGKATMYKGDINLIR